MHAVPWNRATGVAGTALGKAMRNITPNFGYRFNTFVYDDVILWTAYGTSQVRKMYIKRNETPSRLSIQYPFDHPILTILVQQTAILTPPPTRILETSFFL